MSALTMMGGRNNREGISVEGTLTEFAALIRGGMESWVKAGGLLVKMYANGVTRERVLESCPDLSTQMLARFAALGQKKLDPRTLLSNSPGMNYVRDLPYEEQGRLIEDGMEVVMPSGNVCMKKPQDLGAHEVKVVFDDYGKLRSVAEQRKIQEKRQGKGRKPQTFNSGDRTGWDVETPKRKASMSLDELANATPVQLLLNDLTEAQASLLEARRHLAKARLDSRLDDQISAALSSIGMLRFAVSAKARTDGAD